MKSMTFLQVLLLNEFIDASVKTAIVGIRAVYSEVHEETV